MDNINFIKNIDSLGRVVIPMDIRRKLQINTGDVLNISCSDKEIMLSKYSNIGNNLRIVEILKQFVEYMKINVILVDKDRVIFSNLVNPGINNSNKIKLLVKNGTSIKNIEEEYIFGENKVKGFYNMVPIITKEGIDGSLIVFGSAEKNNYYLCELISKILMLELNII